jgi:hypothetical protein
MHDKLLLLLAGFFLTTICGGLVGTLLQQRAWRQKWEMESAQKKIETTERIFDLVSSLLDQRLFRTDQLSIWIQRADTDKVEIALQAYRDVLLDWNDNINRHLAMLQIYFGTDIREEFDFKVGAKFVEVGAESEAIYRSFKDEGNIAAHASNVRKLIEELRREVYEYNLKLLNRIESYRQVRKASNLLDDMRSLFLTSTA